MDIDIKTQTVYNLYEKGEIIPHAKDTERKRAFIKVNGRPTTTYRSSAGNIFVSKLSICKCGKIVIARNITLGSCEACKEKKQKERQKKWYRANKRQKKKPGNLIETKTIKNNHLADSSRYDCTRRMVCRDKWIKYECVPCLNCDSYERADNIFEV